MYIKRIELSGFRSFRNCVIDDLSPGLNIIVGPNGSGKSNIICALDFVFTKNYWCLDSGQREMLICQKNVANVPAPMAVVEIEIDNSDFHFPIPEKQLIVRRQLTKNSDQYYINGSLANYQALQTILETGGFSNNNSYYLVKQGVITEIALSSNQYLLDVLKGIGGADTYDERKKSSLKMLQDTEQEFEELKNKIQLANHNLELLNIDAELMGQFQELDAVHKYLQARHNQMEALKYGDMAKKEKVECQRLQAILETAFNEVTQIEARVESKEKEINKLRPQLENHKDKLEMKRCLIQELSDQIGQFNKGHDLQSESIDESSQKAENIDQQIMSTKMMVQDIEKGLEVVRANASAAQKQTSNVEKKIKNLSLLRRFAAELDDAAIQRSIDIVLADLDKESKHYQQLKADCDAIFSALNEKVAHSANYDIELDEKIQQRRECLEKIEELKQTQADGVILHKTLLAHIAVEQKNIVEMESQINRKMVKLNSITNMAFEGRLSLLSLMSQLKAQIGGESAGPDTTAHYESIINGYHGQVIDVLEFDREEELDRPLEALIKNRLFYHIVDDEHVVNKILHEIKERDLKGSFNFLVLSQLRSAPHTPPNEQSLKGKVVPMTNFIKYDEVWKPIVDFIFEGKYVCRDFEICCDCVEMSTNCDFATIDGDMIDHHGVIITYGRGGQDTRRVLFKQWKALVDKHGSATKRLSNFTEKLKNHSEQTAKKAIDLVEAENKLSAINASIQEHDRFSPAHSFKYTKQLSQLRNQIDEYDNMVACCEDEKLFWRSLGDASKIRALVSSEATDDALKELSEQHSQLKIQCNSLGEEILSNEMNLEKKRTELAQLSQQKSVAQKSEELKSTTTHKLNYERVQMKTLKDYEENFNKHSINIEEESRKLNELSEELDRERAVLREANENLETLKKDYQKRLRKVHNYEDLTLKARVECEQVNTLNVPQRYLQLEGPDDISSAYKLIAQQLDNLSKKKMTRETIRTYRELFQKSQQLTEHLDRMTKLLERSQTFIQTIEAKKTEMVVRTYKQVNTHFQEIFRKFVSAGSCCIQFIRDNNNIGNDGGGNSSNDINNSLNSTISGFETLHRASGEFIGLEILASFKSRHPDKELMSLSGGEKALVSLAFIMALQRVDPTPFYIFDEIDQSLDPTYRDIVAELVAEQSRTKQFLVITFRQQLVAKGDTFFGVRNDNGISHVQLIRREQALNFITENAELAMIEEEAEQADTGSVHTKTTVI